eukprot:gene36392-43318_t
MFGTSDINGAAHVVQLALTPIFLLTGLASLLNVFSTRLGRISDRVDRLAGDAVRHPRQLARLRLRSAALDLAVLLATLAGALTCCAALTLFVGALRNAGTGHALVAFFGSALLCAILALAAFGFETVLSGRSVREQANADGDQQEDLQARTLDATIWLTLTAIHLAVIVRAILLEDRDSYARAAWVLLLVLLPGIGTVLYL